MITANMRNRPFITEPMKISGIQTLEEAKEFVERLTDTLAKQEMLSLGEQVRNFKTLLSQKFLNLAERSSNTVYKRSATIRSYPGRCSR